MRTAQFIRLGVVVAFLFVLAAGPSAQAQEKKDDKVKELLEERLACLRELVKAAESAYATKKVPLERLVEGQRMLLNAQLEMCQSHKERITMLEQMVALTKGSEKTAHARYKAGAVAQSDALMATAVRLEAEIALKREKAKSKGSGKPM